MGTSLLTSSSLLELLIKGEYSLSKDSVVNCQKIQCFLLLPAAWATHKLFSPPQHSSASAQHLALLTVIRCLQLLFLLAFFLTHPFLSPRSHTETAISLLWALHFSPGTTVHFSPVQEACRRAELSSSPAAARGEGGRLPHNLCSFGIQTHSLWWSKFTSSWQQFQRWPFAPHSSAKERCLALWRWGVRTYRLNHPLEPAPGRTSSQGESCLHTD